MRSDLLQQVDSLPELVSTAHHPLVDAIKRSVNTRLCQSVERVFIVGCGDSHHAALAAALAIEQLAGLPCQPVTSMQFARYQVGFLPGEHVDRNVVVAVSVSGRVSRTVEALALAREAGAATIALTGDLKSPLAQTADKVVSTKAPALPGSGDRVVPGARSFVVSLLALYLLAIHVGRRRLHLSQDQAHLARGELLSVSEMTAETIAMAEPVAQAVAEAWTELDHLVFCSAGPNFGSAQFCAAKILEASGDPAIAQDLEEWAHLQYFSRPADTPTFLISAGGWDADRAAEIAIAATTIGRRVALIAPEESNLVRMAPRDFLFPVSGPLRECYSPLLTCLPGLLYAAYRSEMLLEPYFRAFGGGRSREGGGGISRIRTSHQIRLIHR